MLRLMCVVVVVVITVGAFILIIFVFAFLVSRLKFYHCLDYNVVDSCVCGCLPYCMLVVEDEKHNRPVEEYLESVMFAVRIRIVGYNRNYNCTHVYT